MPASMIWLPVSYEMAGCIGTSRKVTLVNVCEVVGFAVECDEVAAAPVEFRLSSPMFADEHFDRRLREGVGEVPERDPIEVRRSTAGLISPAYDVGGTKPLRVDRVGAIVDGIEALRTAAASGRRCEASAPGIHLGPCPHWLGGPLASPFAPPLAEAWPRDSVDFRTVQYNGRDEALAAAHVRMSRARIVDGVLWKACGQPVWALSRVDNERDVLRVMLPGHDTLDASHPLSLRANVRDDARLGVPHAFAPIGTPVEDMVATLEAACPERRLEVVRGLVDAWGPDAPLDRVESIRAASQQLRIFVDRKWGTIPPPMRMPLATLEDVVARHAKGGLDPDEAWHCIEDAVSLIASRMRGLPRPDLVEGGREVDVASSMDAMIEVCRRNEPVPDVVGDEQVAAFSP